jgi:hypothetical protein
MWWQIKILSETIINRNRKYWAMVCKKKDLSQHLHFFHQQGIDQCINVWIAFTKNLCVALFQDIAKKRTLKQLSQL